jgi:two-component system nitrate/nitrite sensor histidine kinase NarX
MAENSRDGHNSIYRRVGRLRWQAALLAVALVLLHQWVEHAYLFFLPRWTHFWTQVAFYGVVGPSLAWLALTSLRNQMSETEQAERAMRRSRDELAQVNLQLEFLIGVERRMAEAEDEDQLIEAILELPLEVVPALGVSLIRLDEDGTPLPAIHHGDLAPEEFESWTAHLATTEISQSCASCSARKASSAISCPLLKAAPEELHTQKVHCLLLGRGSRDFGMLNIYLPAGEHPSVEEEGLLEVMATSISLALESHELRNRELGTLHHLQQIHHLEGLEPQLFEVVSSTMEALELDGGAVFLVDGEDSLDVTVSVGEAPGANHELLVGMARAVQHSSALLLGGEVGKADGGEGGVRSLLVAPLRKDDRWLGSLLFWLAESATFSNRQKRIIESVASQTALLVENHRLYREVEYRAGLAERARLAREIHDGLAQTLGYLKLRTSQLARWVEKGNSRQVAEAIDELRRLLDEAYVDAREAIDGLRVDLREGRFDKWLADIYQEFEELSDIRVNVSSPPRMDLPLEVQSQLLRIIQEALGNIRKHAGAAQVWVDWDTDDHWIVLKIRDDGRGFNPREVAVISQHGLRIMRERAELLGADFQVMSRLGEGTEVMVGLPLAAVVGRGAHG